MKFNEKKNIFSSFPWFAFFCGARNTKDKTRNCEGQCSTLKWLMVSARTCRPTPGLETKRRRQRQPVSEHLGHTERSWLWLLSAVRFWRQSAMLWRTRVASRKYYCPNSLPSLIILVSKQRDLIGPHLVTLVTGLLWTAKLIGLLPLQFGNFHPIRQNYCWYGGRGGGWPNYKFIRFGTTRTIFLNLLFLVFYDRLFLRNCYALSWFPRSPGSRSFWKN